MENNKIDFSFIVLDGSYFLMVNKTGTIQVSDYKIQSSADGETELCITIKGIPSALELTASLEQLMK